MSTCSLQSTKIRPSSHYALIDWKDVRWKGRRENWSSHPEVMSASGRFPDCFLIRTDDIKCHTIEHSSHSIKPKKTFADQSVRRLTLTLRTRPFELDTGDFHGSINTLLLCFCCLDSSDCTGELASSSHVQTSIAIKREFFRLTPNPLTLNGHRESTNISRENNKQNKNHFCTKMNIEQSYVVLFSLFDLLASRSTHAWCPFHELCRRQKSRQYFDFIYRSCQWKYTSRNTWLRHSSNWFICTLCALVDWRLNENKPTKSNGGSSADSFVIEIECGESHRFAGY